MYRIFKELKGVELKIPFPRLSFSEAQAKHNTDKPDLRKDFNSEFAFVWVVDSRYLNIIPKKTLGERASSFYRACARRLRVA